MDTYQSNFNVIYNDIRVFEHFDFSQNTVLCFQNSLSEFCIAEDLNAIWIGSKQAFDSIAMRQKCYSGQLFTTVQSYQTE